MLVFPLVFSMASHCDSNNEHCSIPHSYFELLWPHFRGKRCLSSAPGAFRVDCVVWHVMHLTMHSNLPCKSNVESEVVGSRATGGVCNFKSKKIMCSKFKLSLVLFTICNFIVDCCSSQLALEANNNFTLTICHPHVRGMS